MGLSWGLLLLVGLGAVQLAAGLILGRCWPARRRERQQTHERARLKHLARQMLGVAGSLHEDVGQHRAQLHAANEQLRTLSPAEGEHFTSIVLDTAARILQTNQRLQQRLGDAERQLQHQSQQLQLNLTAALTDPLTGLGNRRAFDDDLAAGLARWQSTRHSFGLLAIDADHFKTINDRFGHQAGDRTLCQLAVVLRETLAAWGAVYRIGGEELAAVLYVSHAEDAKRLAEKARRAVAATIIDPALRELRMTVSVGVAMVQPGDTGPQLLKRADQALYTAKHAGRNCTCWHDGQACQRLLDAAPPAAPAESDSEELGVLCDDLRAKLSEVVG